MACHRSILARTQLPFFLYNSTSLTSCFLLLTSIYYSKTMLCASASCRLGLTTSNAAKHCSVRIPSIAHLTITPSFSPLIQYLIAGSSTHFSGTYQGRAALSSTSAACRMAPAVCHLDRLQQPAAFDSHFSTSKSRVLLEIATAFAHELA